MAFLGGKTERRHAATAFSIRGKGFVGLGFQDFIDSRFFKDFWEYTPADSGEGQWVKKTDFQGVNRRGAVGFAWENGGVGYVAGGDFFPLITTDITAFNDLWKYIPSAE